MRCRYHVASAAKYRESDTKSRMFSVSAKSRQKRTPDSLASACLLKGDEDHSGQEKKLSGICDAFI